MKVIKTEEEYDSALIEVETLMEADPEPGTEDGDKLELLALLINNYEEKYYPLDMPDPIEAIKFRMDQEGLSQRDLMPLIGSRGKVSEVLSGKTPLSLKMMRALNKELGIPAEVLLQEPGAILPKEVEWDKYPLKAMSKLQWFDNAPDSLNALKEMGEELIQSFIRKCNFPKEQTVLFRKSPHLRSNAKTDRYALSAWQARVWYLANQIQIPKNSEIQKIDLEFIQEVAKLSTFRDGPKLAQEYLLNHGIILIIQEHLPKTYLDGAALKRDDGTPVIALSLRYDRLDNFWFTLCHELAHLAKHFESEETDQWFLDDLDVNGDGLEDEADELAQKALIPDEKWKIKIDTLKTPQSILNYAKKFQRHPAIIAGRIRKDSGNYRIFSRMVGSREVRRQFGME